MPTPWGEEEQIDSTDNFDLPQIERNGEIIVATMSGPETYYDYRGRGLGTAYLLCERFAQKIGVIIRVELCRDSDEIVAKLASGDADLGLLVGSEERGERSENSLENEADEQSISHSSLPTPHSPLRFVSDSLNWLVSTEKPALSEAINDWYSPDLLAQVKTEEQNILSAKSVRRRVFAPLLNAKDGIISKYDELFIRYARPIKWDWRLMAAQCYQESTFDPHARSWAGAQGLMQIMPETARHLGLAASDVYDPEKNIAAAAKYLNELRGHFSDIADPQERDNFVMAAYNGGFFHIRDAMALARKHGEDPSRWSNVSKYVLLLSDAEYYRDPVVKYGYMRGTETVEYVRRIRERFQTYSGVNARGAVQYAPQRAKHRKKKYS